VEAALEVNCQPLAIILQSLVSKIASLLQLAHGKIKAIVEEECFHCNCIQCLLREQASAKSS